MPRPKFINLPSPKGRPEHFMVRDAQGRMHREQFHRLGIWLPSHNRYEAYPARMVAFATMLDWFWRQNTGTLWEWRSSINSVGRYFMQGIRWPDQERNTYTRAKEIIREGAFGEFFERDGIVYVYASTRGGRAASGYCDQRLVAEQYDDKNQRMLRLMLNRVATGTVEPAVAGLGANLRVARPRIKTLN